MVFVYPAVAVAVVGVAEIGPGPRFARLARIRRHAIRALHTPRGTTDTAAALGSTPVVSLVDATVAVAIDAIA